MSKLFIVIVTVAATALPARAQDPAPPERVGEIRVHGNHTTPDTDVLSLAGISVGTPLTPAVLPEAAARLRQSGRFSGVEIRKRFRSISDPSDILIILLVDELPGISETDLTPSPMKRVWGAGMWLPVLDYSDGYGFTYGARFSFVNALGRRSRISTPVTWGGERRAAVEVDRTFERGPFSRVEGALTLQRRENPHFEIGDLRREARVRGERTVTSWLRAGGGVRVTNVRFGALDETHTAPGFDVIIDTRRDPAYPRNAIHAAVGWERLLFGGRMDADRRLTDIRGYIGLVGSSVLALRLTTSQSTAPLPEYERALLGGTSMLRGYRHGYRAADNLATASAEVRVPLNSPLDLGRFGVKAFVDYGTVYPYGAKLSDQVFDRGVGGGVFLTATVVRMGLDVAWPTSGKPRWHFGLGVTF